MTEYKAGELRERLLNLPRPSEKTAKYLVQFELDEIESFIKEEKKQAQVGLLNKMKKDLKNTFSTGEKEDLIRDAILIWLEEEEQLL